MPSAEVLVALHSLPKTRRRELVAFMHGLVAARTGEVLRSVDDYLRLDVTIAVRSTKARRSA